MPVRIEDIGRPSKPRFISRSQREARKEYEEERLRNVSEQNGGTGGAASSNKADQAVKASSPVNLPSWRLKREAELSQSAQLDSPRRTFGKKWTEKTAKEMTDREWGTMMKDLGITITPKVSELPLLQFSELPQNLAQKAYDANYKVPTPVQRTAIPIAMGGHDLVAIAETGSGKTASFLIPLVDEINGSFSSGLILTPTRELAIQIGQEAEKFADFPCAVIVGGRDIVEQSRDLEKASLVIATPGRLIDCIHQNLVNLSNCRMLVVDEADKMIDMGFEEQITEIIAKLPPRQTLMYSATWPQSVQNMAKKLNPNFVHLQITPSKQGHVQHRIEYVDRPKRLQTIISEVKTFLDSNKKGKAIIFVSKKLDCDILESSLSKLSASIGVIHGSKSQEQREAVIDSFRFGKLPVIIATDVLGRGIDISDVVFVVNYDMPRSLETWIHRVGRTGRAGRSGTTVSYVDDHDKHLFTPLRAFLKGKGQKVPDFLTS